MKYNFFYLSIQYGKFYVQRSFSFHLTNIFYDIGDSWFPSGTNSIAAEKVKYTF